MRFPRLSRSKVGEAASDVLPDSSVPSSPAAMSGSFVSGDYVLYYPTPSFADRYEAYDTIGRIFSAVESVIKAINKRDFYFANVDEKNDSQEKIKQLEKWEHDNNASKFIEELVRAWLKGGTAIIGPDWQLVPMVSVKYMKTDIYRRPVEIILDVNGKEWPLGSILTANGSFDQKIELKDYIISHYIHDNRDAWGKNLYYAICTTPPDDKEAVPIFKGFRQIEQDGIKIHRRMASPRSFTILPKLRNKGELDTTNPKSLAYRFKNMKAGDRVLLGPDGEGAQIIAEPIEGRTRFTEMTDLVKGEVEVTAQSSAARLIEDPSAMADARVAGDKDSDTVLYVCELVRRLFDYIIIPRIIGDMSVEFKWGNSDQFNLSFEDIKSLSEMQIGGQPVVSVEEVRDLLKKQGTPLDDSKYKDSSLEPKAGDKGNK